MTTDTNGTKLEFNTPYLNHYLRMVEETESPRIMHLWVALGIISASLGRRNYLPFGYGQIFPNQYILLVGTPGTRKSTALSIGKKILKQSTGVNFAPDDTAGQRQGLIQAMLQNSTTETLYLDGVKLDQRDNTLSSILSMDQVARLTDEIDEATREIDAADKQHLVATSDEFSRFIGQNNLQMLDFLTSTWDGHSFQYRTTTKMIEVKQPLLNLVGCTTPVSLANSMPPAAGGQGFLSRMILVYGSTKYKSLPRPAVPPEEEVNHVKEILDHSHSFLAGEFAETKEARSYSEQLYDYPIDITDSRFGYYAERRYTHLIKLAMACAAGRKDQTIVKDDYEEAHRILRATEVGMPEALGEFGMNPLATLKQGILEFVKGQGSIAIEELRGHFHRDSRANDFSEALNDLHRAKQVIMQQSKNGAPFVTARMANGLASDAMLQLLAQK